MMLCVNIEVVRVANDYLNCLEVEVGVTLVGALAPSADYTHIWAVQFDYLDITLPKLTYWEPGNNDNIRWYR